MSGGEVVFALALVAWVTHAMLSRTFGHGLAWWAIAGLIVIYAIGCVVNRCARTGGWRWMGDLYEAELAIVRASFMALPAAAPPQPRTRPRPAMREV